MSKPQKILTIVLWILAVGGMVGVVAMRTLPPNPPGPGSAIAAGPVSTAQPPPGRTTAEAVDPSVISFPVLYSVPAFALTDQDGKTATSTQFLGRPWIADFFFTSCATLCPVMSAHMQELQRRLPNDIDLVSFSVDPVHDTPPILKDYALTFRAQDGRWFFLTGDPADQDRVIRAMKIGVVPAQANSPIPNDEHFLLIDPMGNVRGIYDSLVPQELDKLVRDANSLLPDTSGVAP